MPKVKSRKKAAKKAVKKAVKVTPLRIQQIVDGLAELYPDVHCELVHRNAFELVCATIMSAQCTDDRVNMVTPGFFQRWPDAHALAAANPNEVESVIHSTGFFRNKTKNLIGMARTLVEQHGGEVPRTMDQLLALPGVARKTANVVLGTAFGIADGVVVDTHVTRLSNLLGLTGHPSDAVKIEQDLMQIVPREQWIAFAHRMIWHGRRVCIANRPQCERCPLPCPSRLTVGKPADKPATAKKKKAAAASASGRARPSARSGRATSA